MKNYSLLSILAALLLSSPGAVADENGGLFVEPAITYETSKSTLDWPAPFSDSTGSSKGFGLAARLGLHISEVVFIAADGRYSKPTFKNSANGYDATAEAMNLGAVLGVQMPEMGLRIWASSILTGSLNPERSQNTNVKFEDAKGYRVGVGFRVSSVSLNLEYQRLTYDKSTLEEVGPIAPGLGLGKLDDASYIASVSFPLEL